MGTHLFLHICGVVGQYKNVFVQRSCSGLLVHSALRNLDYSGGARGGPAGALAPPLSMERQGIFSTKH
jgi:hypothetical protein